MNNELNFNGSGRKARVVATRKQSLEIMRLLDQYMVLRENGTWVYTHGESDSSIAAKVDPSGRLGPNNVMGIRKQMKGPIIKHPGKGKNEDRERRKINLMERLDVIEQKIDSLLSQWK